MFTYQVAKIHQDVKQKKVSLKGGKKKKTEEFYAKVTTITLVQVPYMNLLNARDIYQNTVIWYDFADKFKDKEASLMT